MCEVMQTKQAAFGGNRWKQRLAVSLGLAGVLAFGNAMKAVAADVLPVGQFYTRYCAACHGADGKNLTLDRVFPDLPDFSDPNWEATHTKAELTESILHGKGAMPAWQGDLRGHTAAELVDYLREFSQHAATGSSVAAPSPSTQAAASADPQGDPRVVPDPPPPSNAPVPMAQFYARYCAACHGSDGKNPNMIRIFPDLPDFSDPNWEATHTKVELTDSLLHGKGAMPAWKGDLRGHTPSEVIDYLRAFSQQPKTPHGGSVTQAARSRSRQRSATAG